MSPDKLYGYTCEIISTIKPLNMSIFRSFPVYLGYPSLIFLEIVGLLSLSINFHCLKLYINVCTVCFLVLAMASFT